MRVASLVALECRAALAGPRGAAVRVGATLLLGLPFALLDLPLGAGSAGLAGLVVLVGLFGSTVAGVRRREDGRADRLRLLPQPRWLSTADGCLAGAAVDLVQVAPPLALWLALRAADGGIGSWLAVAGMAAGSLLFLNGVGAVLAGAARSGAEAHLLGALACALLAAGSGLVPLPPRLGGVVEAGAAWSPVGVLAGALRAAGEGTAVPWGGSASVLALFGAAFAARAAGWPGPRTPPPRGGRGRH
ncbi:MAG: hypothetical protein SCH98_06795 [Deferrisomatales bacterium]|nr:hypothetical protein [Deferrisomatales bacterium]